MFVINENRSGLNKDGDRIISLLGSINEPMIAAADRPAEPTQAFIATVDASQDRCTTHIVLYLRSSGSRVMYSWEKGDCDPKDKGRVEEQALDFVENMGFMMDNMNIEKLSLDQRSQLLSEIPVFSDDQEAASVDESGPMSGGTFAQLDALAADEIDAAGMESVEIAMPDEGIETKDFEAHVVDGAISAVDELDAVFERSVSDDVEPVLDLEPEQEEAYRPDEGEALELSESEFERLPDEEPALDAIMEPLDTFLTAEQAEGPSGPVAADDAKARALVRLLASL